MKKRFIIRIATTLGVVVAGVLAWRALFPPPSYQGQPISDWVDELSSTDYHASHRAQTTIPEIGAAAAPELIKLLRHRESPLTVKCREQLSRIAWLHWKVLDYSRGRLIAAQLLPAIGADPVQTIPVLVETLSDDDKNLAATAREALIQSGPSAVPQLSKALAEGNAQTRYLVVSALVDFGADAQAAVPVLIDTTHDSIPEIRSQAIIALSRASSDAAPVLPALTGALNDHVITVRLDAIAALGFYGEKAAPAVPALVNALKDSQLWVRSTAAFALSRIGPQAREAAPPLRKLLSDESVHVRISSSLALWEIEHDAAPLLPVLRNALLDPNDRIRSYAAQTLVQIGPPAYTVIPDILVSLKSQIEPDSYNSILRLLAESNASAVPYLVSSAHDGDAHVRMGALMVLGKMAVKNSAAVPELKHALNDSDAGVRTVAQRALQKLQSQPAESTAPGSGG